MNPHEIIPSAIERPIDVRDLSLGTAGFPESIPATFMQDAAFAAPIYYQAKQPACGAHAGAWLKGFLGALATPSPRFIWESIKFFDGIPIESGTDMRSIFKSLQKGVLPLSQVPNTSDMPDQDYAAPTDLTIANIAQAGQDIIDNYAFQDNPTFDQLKQLIYANKAVLILLRIGESFYTAPDGRISWAEADTQPLRVPSPIIGGHFVVAHSYDEKYIYFANSFSQTYGRNGHGYFGPEYMPYVVEAGTAIDHATAVAISDKLGLLSKSLTSTQDPTSPQVKWLADLMKKLGL